MKLQVLGRERLDIFGRAAVCEMGVVLLMIIGAPTWLSIAGLCGCALGFVCYQLIALRGYTQSACRCFGPLDVGASIQGFALGRAAGAALALVAAAISMADDRVMPGVGLWAFLFLPIVLAAFANRLRPAGRSGDSRFSGGDRPLGGEVHQRGDQPITR
jgi:hypothetical protein